MRTFLEIYFAINIFLAGHEFKNSMDWARDPAEKIMACLTAIKNIVAFIPHMALIFIYALLKWAIWTPINDHFQLAFFFSFYLTKNWDNVEQDKLYAINQRLKRRPEGDNRIGARIFDHCVKMVNKRNNYTFIEKQTENE